MVEKIQWIYYGIQNFFAATSLLYGITYWKKIKQNRYLNLLPIYLFFSILCSCFWFLSLQYPGVLIQNFFLPFEFFVFFNFFIKVLKNKRNYFTLIAICIIFFLSLIIVVTFLYSKQTKHISIISFLSNYTFPEIIVIANILAVIPIILYYVSLFNRPYIKNLSSDPVFLAMTGILFYAVLTIPTFVFQKILWYQNKSLYLYLYAINPIAYIIMFLFFIKAFKSIK